MKAKEFRNLYALLTRGSLIALFVFAAIISLPAQSNDWVTLFDGTSIGEWKLMQEGGWKIVDGLLVPQTIRRNNYIWTKKQYEDFELDLEFKMSEQCNSGVFVRSDPENPVQGGFEIQLFDSYGRSEVGTHDCGALYDAQAPSANTAKPAGEWNRMRIQCQGPTMAVTLNGKKIVDANIDQWTEPQKNPDGSENKFKTALKNLPRQGHIGLQYHGHPIWFRNIKIRNSK